MGEVGGPLGARSGSDVELELDRTGGRGVGYRAAPASGRGRAVLVSGDDGGLSDFVRDACDRLARAGFVALAPDPGSAGAADPDAALAAGVARLLDDDASEGPRVGVLGFGSGGALALGLAASHPRVGAVVDFYGLPSEAQISELGALETPTLLAFGAEDARIADGRVAALEARLPGARLRTVANAGDGYMDDRRPDCHVATAAAAGWEAAIAFLRATL